MTVTFYLSIYLSTYYLSTTAGACPARPLHVHGRPHLLHPVLLRREGREGHQVRVHPGRRLVGSHHHDHRGVRGHLPGYSRWEVHRCEQLGQV